MGSRIRENVKHLIECFCEVVGPQSTEEPWIIQKFPDSFKEEEVLKSIPIFAYPCEFQNAVVQHYSFVLTSLDSKYTFGFCRHDPKTETALVVLSYLPWHETFYKLLNHIATITHSQKGGELSSFLDAVYRRKVPDPGNTVEIPFGDGQSKFVCQSPNQFQLPSIPENRNLTEYYNAVDTQNMMLIFASMLYERRIIFKSKKLYRLSACVQSANAIIYPMNWQHIFIPVLPMKLMDYLFAPMPYLIGVPEIIYDRVRKNDLGDVVLLDADNNTVETPFDDLATLPVDVVNSLRRHLRNRSALLGDGVSRAFLRSLVQLIGGYRDALRFNRGQLITFDNEAFVKSRPLPMQPFLRQMLQLQIFQQFKDERLEMLNNGLGFSDEFEMEACSYSEKSSSKLKHQYKEWTHTMKKEGSAFFKTVRNKVRERGKDVHSAYKGMRNKWRDSSVVPPEKPRSAPTSPTLTRRPQTVAMHQPSMAATRSYRKGGARSTKSTAHGSARPYVTLGSNNDASTPDPSTPDPSTSNPSTSDAASATPHFQLSPMDMDLMTELKHVIYPSSMLDCPQAESPPVDRTLKPVRSLESFQSSSYGGSASDSAWLSSPHPIPSASDSACLSSSHPITPHHTRHHALTRTDHTAKPVSQGFKLQEFSTLSQSPFHTSPSSTLVSQQLPTLSQSPFHTSPSSTLVSQQLPTLSQSPFHTSPRSTPVSQQFSVVSQSPFHTSPSSTPVSQQFSTLNQSPFHTSPSSTLVSQQFPMVSQSPRHNTSPFRPSPGVYTRTPVSLNLTNSTRTLSTSPLPLPLERPPMSNSYPPPFSPDFPYDSRDLFGATAFVVNGVGAGEAGPVCVVACPPPPPQHASKRPDGSDLIRLDSMPDIEFDPILAKDRPPRAPTSSVDPGVSNPLYPYFVPATSSSRPLVGLNSVQMSGYDQDSALLQDYGLDFKSLSFHNGSQSSLGRSPQTALHAAQHSAVAKDPFDSLSVFNKSATSQNIPQKKWTKFE